MAHPAKITRPKSLGVFQRHRLFQLLDSIGEPIIWITAPPGAGKTTLAASWLESRLIPCLWYQVDEGDSDLASFFYYMGLAVKRAAPRKKQLPFLTPEYMLGISTFSRHFFENVYSRLTPPGIYKKSATAEKSPAGGPGGPLSDCPRPFAMVFDNYQEVPEGSAFDEILYQGLSLVPTRLKIIIISRKDAPEAFIRLKANGLIKTICRDELKLTLDESEKIVSLRGHRNFAPEIIRQLHEITDGWAAGIVLLLEGARDNGIESALSKVQASKEIFQYFSREIFRRTEPGTQEFLLKTSLLPRFSVEMAEDLTGCDRALHILSDLNDRNYFIQRHESDTAVYQYHPLFRDFLWIFANEHFGRGIVDLERKAASILQEKGELEDAFNLFEKAEAWSEAIQLILKHAPELAGQGRGQTLAGWINALPNEIVESVPWLLYWKGVCLLAGSPAESQSEFRRAFDLFRSGPDAVGTSLSLSGVFDSILYSFGTYKPFDEALALLEEVLREHPNFPSPEIEARLTANKLFAIVNRDPGHPDLKKTAERAHAIFRVIPDLNIKMQLFQALCHLALVTGEFQDAVSSFDLMRNAVLSRHVSHLLKIWFKTCEVVLYWFTAEFQRCRSAAEDGLELASGTGVRIMDTFFWGYMTATALGVGDRERVEPLLEKMATSMVHSPYMVSFYHHLCWWKLFLEGEFSKSLSYAELSLKECLDAGTPLIVAAAHFGAALALHELKRDNEAMNHLAESHAYALSANASMCEFTFLLMEAKFAFDNGDGPSGLASLKKAFSIGREKGFMNMPLCWVPAMMAELCQKALETGIEVDYVRRLIRKRNLMPDPPPIDCEEWPWALKIYTLGRFEIIRDGKTLEFCGKIQKKPLELLKVLVSNGGSETSDEYIGDCLWPDAPGDAAHSAFTTTLSRLRRLLGVDGAIRFQEGRVSLDPRFCWLDARAFKRILQKLERIIEGEYILAESTNSLTALLDKGIDIYRGHFLCADAGQFWTISYRERLRNGYFRLITTAGERLEMAGQWEKALKYYRKGIEIDEFSEEYYQRLMICYQKLGRQADAIEVYRHYSRLLSMKMGIEPSTRAKAIYEKLRN